MKTTLLRYWKIAAPFLRIAIAAWMLWHVYLGSRGMLVTVLVLLTVEAELNALLWKRMIREQGSMLDMLEKALRD